MSSFYAKGSAAQERQLKVQRLSIPFTVTHSATSTSVVLANDEPSVLFLKSQGVDYIGPELTTLGDTATYVDSPSDSSGVLNMFLYVEEPIAKICSANVIDRVNGGSLPCELGSATGLSSLNNMMLTLDSSINFTTTDGNLCLQVEYVVADENN